MFHIHAFNKLIPCNRLRFGNSGAGAAANGVWSWPTYRFRMATLIKTDHPPHITNIDRLWFTSAVHLVIVHFGWLYLVIGARLWDKAYLLSLHP